MQLVKL